MPRKKKVAQPSPNAAAAAAAANSPPEAASPPTLETTASNESAEADMSEAEDGGTSPQSNRSDGGLAGMESPRENVWEDLDSLQSPGAGGGIPSTIVRGIIVGTIASSKVSTSKVVDESEASHQWSCFVRGPDDYDVSTFIKQVVFSLHPSFNNSVRSFKSPPYEIHEEGWGEFDIAVKLHFWPDSQLRPVEFIHQLKLYPNENAAAAQAVSKKPVVNEIYHELIFTEPEPTFAKRLSTRVLGAGNQSALARYREDIRAHFRPFDDNEKAKAIKKVTIYTPCTPLSLQSCSIFREHKDPHHDAIPRDVSERMLCEYR